MAVFLKNQPQNSNFMIYSKIIKRLYTKAAKNSKWQSVVGLEIHAQISSKSKLFSGAPTDFSSPVNTNVSLFDCSIPGTLPVLNKYCVEAGVITALALNCEINPVSMFDRKHYFYADLPAGYQITQQRSPLARNGHLEFQVFTPGVHKTPYKTSVRIKQVQLEQDSGKSLHDVDRSLVDLNRAGVPLMELVFEPDLKNGEEAAALVKELVNILEKIRTCSCKMEEGALRVDANVSIHQKNEPFGVRTEIKNIGSVRGVANAIHFEIQRQIELKEMGEIVINETRAWDANSKSTIAMRDKEELQDYRYMPEPNLPPLHLAMGVVRQGCVNVDELKKSLPELPEETRRKLQDDFGLSVEQAIILVNENYLFNLFQQALSDRKISAKLLANLLINDFTRILHKMDNARLNHSCEIGVYLGEIAELLEFKKINRNTARLLIEEIIKGNNIKPIEIVKERNWMQITDETELKNYCEEVIAENEKIVKQYQSGKTKVFKALLGKIADKSNQRADMAKCSTILENLLKK